MPMNTPWLKPSNSYLTGYTGLPGAVITDTMTIRSSASTWEINGNSSGDLLFIVDGFLKWVMFLDGRLQGWTSGSVFVTQDDPGGVAQLRLSGATVRVASMFTPASGTASGNTGEICWNNQYVFVCTSANSWSRATLNRF